MCKTFARISLFIILLLFFQGIVYADIGVNRQEIELSDLEIKQFNTVFSNFYEAGLGEFTKDQLSDDELIAFSIRHIILNWRLRDNYCWEIHKYKLPAEYVDYVAQKYFGKVVVSHHTAGRFIFEDGNYVFDRYFKGFVEFSRIKKLYDNGDGTYTAIVQGYLARDDNPESIEIIRENDDGTCVATITYTYKDGKTNTIPYEYLRREGKYRAVIKPVYEGESKRYILLEYLKIRDNNRADPKYKITTHFQLNADCIVTSQKKGR